MPILILITAFSSLVGMGGAPRVSAHMGEGDYAGAERILGNCFTNYPVDFRCHHPCAAAVYVSHPTDVRASGETLPYATSYLRIYSLGTVFMQIALGMNFSSAPRALPKPA